MESGESVQEYNLTTSLVMTPWNQRLIENEREYNNPLIVEKMIDFFDLDEIGSNYPKNVYNPHKLEAGDYFEELAKRQTELL